jgi:hypothetical protein
MERENREPRGQGPDEEVTIVQEQISFQFVSSDSAAGETQEGRVDESAEAPDPSLPAEDDWKFRPYSASERYTDPRTEIGFAHAMTEARTNYPAITGLALAVLAAVPGGAGLVLAIAAIFVSAWGLIAASRGAKRRAWAIAGVLLGAALTAAHWLLPY